MGVGSIRGGGNRGGPKGTGKAGGKGAAGRAKGMPSVGRIDRGQRLVGVSDLVGSAEVGGGSSMEQAARIAKAVRSGEIATKSEAARRLVAGILKERMSIQSKALEKQIAEKLTEDPRLAQTLERIWQKA